jgi:holo-[acyl-carrier protein] synthase
MIIGIGNDVVEHDLNNKLIIWDTDGNLPKRILSKEELSSYCSKPNDKYLAGRFAAKEAILKCLGTGMQDGLSLTDIHIANLPTGKPVVILSGSVLELAEMLAINKWHISITHSATFTMAFAIAEHLNT